MWFCESPFRLFLANTWQWLQGSSAKNISHIWMDFRITPPFRWNTDTMSSILSTYIVSPIWGMHHDHPILTLWLATVWLVTIGVGCPRWEGGELSVCRPVKTVFLYMLISLWYKFVLSTVFVLNFCLASWYRRVDGDRCISSPYLTGGIFYWTFAWTASTDGGKCVSIYITSVWWNSIEVWAEFL